MKPKINKSKPKPYSFVSDSYSTHQVAQIAETTLRELQYWDEQDVVQPVHYGHSRQYTGEDLVVACTVSKLRRNGMKLRRVRDAMPILRQIAELQCAEPYSTGAYLVIDETKVVTLNTLTDVAEFAAKKRYDEHFVVLQIQHILFQIEDRVKVINKISA